MNRDTTPSTPRTRAASLSGEQGFMLLGLIVAIAIILLVLSVAAAEVAFTLRRDREVESVHRANQYVRAIQVYYRKFGHYPGSMQQLEGTNNVRYLRKQYVDPLTGKPDYRVIPVGQNITTVKGFFGQPLAGLSSAGLGAAAGSASNGGGFQNGLPTAGGPGASAGATGQAGNQSGSGSGSGASTSGPFMGVGSNATGSSILVVNEQKTYQTWEFLYDPRIEQLRLQANLNGGVGSTGGGAGPASGQSPGFGATGAGSGGPTQPGQTPTGPAPTGSAPGGAGQTPQP
jgi:type II secretory pathway pseudopilin PulG